MKEEIMISAGIDIGTSTTQLIFSRLTIKNISGFGRVPQTEITSKEVFYRSEIYFTPLSGMQMIDGEGVKQIVEKEYVKAALTPSDVDTGAIIITGESSRKRNAEEVIRALSEIAGKFVVAAAGPDLESVLAGKGAGAAALSEMIGKVVVNLDIGGGTTNICSFQEGEILDTACLDIGGRLVKFSDEINSEKRIVYIADKVKVLAKKHLIHICENERVDIAELRKLTDLFADLLAQAAGLKDAGEDLEYIKTNHLLTDRRTDIITFSGGVAACMDTMPDDYAYGDIGVLLAKSILDNEAFRRARIEKATETMRATVIGAGNYSMNISGSTIEYMPARFPIKNLPIAKIRLETSEDIGKVGERLEKAFALFEESENETHAAVAFEGIKCPSFADIQNLAFEISNYYDQRMHPEEKCILVMEADMGKALGQALKRMNKYGRTIICIDNIKCNTGDYIDLGEPIASKTVIPVVVKTLVFQGGIS